MLSCRKAEKINLLMYRSLSDFVLGNLRCYRTLHHTLAHHHRIEIQCSVCPSAFPWPYSGAKPSKFCLLKSRGGLTYRELYRSTPYYKDTHTILKLTLKCHVMIARGCHVMFPFLYNEPSVQSTLFVYSCSFSWWTYQGG